MGTGHMDLAWAVARKPDGKKYRKKAAIGAHFAYRSPARAGTPFAPLDD